ncbi:MAG: hypothetical protein V7764_09505 [Pseudomonas marincola]|uniref:hypothetical protein n=1 Tax=Pseudomonas marincola TaxID=437900 RepID=UPI0030034C44
MSFLRAIGFMFLCVVVPVGALLASNPDAFAQWIGSTLGIEFTRGNLAVAFLLLTGICLKIDLTIRRRHQLPVAEKA